MTGPSIPTQMPDVEAWLIATFGPLLAPSIVRNQKPPANLPDGSPNPDAGKTLLLVRADPANQVTAVSRYCRVSVQAWVQRADGSADLARARDLAADFGRRLEGAPREGMLLDAEVDAGPYRSVDQVTGLEYAYLSLLLQVLVV